MSSNILRGELVTLTPDLDSLAYSIALQRYAINREANRKNDIDDGAHSELDNEHVGARAEVAVRYFLGIDMALSSLVLPQPDNGVDITIKGRQKTFTIDVKFSRYKDAFLMFKSIDKFRAHCAILVVPGSSESELRIVGGVSKKKFAENYTWHEVSWCASKLLALSQQRLESMFAIKKYIAEVILCRY